MDDSVLNNLDTGADTMLSTAEIAILAYLHRSEATSPTIGREVIAAPKAQPTLSRLLRRMELKGLIQSRDAREGPFGRLLAWSITEAGKRALDETWAAFEAMWPALGQDDYDPAALREFIAAGKDMNLWFGNPDSPPDPRRKVVAKRAATRFRDALVALGELPAEEE